MLALFDLSSKVNTVYLAFAKELGLFIRPTDVRAQKINGTTVDTYGMVVEVFLVEDNANRVRFFEETFLVANSSLKVVIGMPFLTLSGADVDFLGRKLQWRTYTTKKTVPTTRRVELVGKKEFAVAALDLEHEIYVVYVGSVNSNTSPSSSLFNVHPFRRRQISSLIAEKVPRKVLAKYSDFADVFSPDLAFKLPEHTGINNHAIKLVEDQQSPYGPIYSLGPVELETLKAYIETNTANGFIRPSKSLIGTPILFDRKSNSSFQLCVDYWGFNKLTIKNLYPFPLIGELLDRLGRAKQFTQPNLISTYHQMGIRKGDKWKTAFRTWYGHFKYQVMSFGLTNMPLSFQRYINKIFTEKFDIFVIVYLD